MIDPNIWQSEDFNKLSDLAKLVFIGLFSLADDEGRGRCNPIYLKSSIFPYKEDLRSADIEKTLYEISSNMSVTFYSCDGNNFYSLYNWDHWQSISRPTPSKIPPFDQNNKDIHVLFTEDSLSPHGGLTPNRKEKNRIENKKKRIEKNIYGQNEVKNEPKNDFADFNLAGDVKVLEAWETQFEEFYRAYPRKVKKQDVKKWFEKNKPSNELFSSMMNSLEQFRASKDWQKDGGQYIPYPSTWLNQKRWEDEGIKPIKPSSALQRAWNKEE